MLDISIIIPAYNEESRIPSTLQEIESYFSGRVSCEIIVVDDGSTDRTYDVCREFFDKAGHGKVLRNSHNRGKGYSVRRGMLEAKGKMRLFSDADMSTPIGEIEKLIAAIGEGYEVAIGSRSLSGSDIKLHQPFYRESMGKIFNLFVRLVTVGGIIDTQCGFKLFTEKASRDIFRRQHIESFSFDVEILFIARKLGYRIKEIPIAWINSPASKVNPITDSAKMLRDLFFIRWMDLKGNYR